MPSCSQKIELCDDRTSLSSSNNTEATSLHKFYPRKKFFFKVTVVHTLLINFTRQFNLSKLSRDVCTYLFFNNDFYYRSFISSVMLLLYLFTHSLFYSKTYPSNYPLIYYDFSFAIHILLYLFIFALPKHLSIYLHHFCTRFYILLLPLYQSFALPSIFPLLYIYLSTFIKLRPSFPLPIHLCLTCFSIYSSTFITFVFDFIFCSILFSVIFRSIHLFLCL